MRRMALLAALVLTLPVLAFANSMDFANQGGSVTGSTSGLTFSSPLIGVTGLSGGPVAGLNLGTVQIVTGALSSGGSLANGGTFGAGSITITSNGKDGLPSGTLFTSTFSSATWKLIGTLPDGTHEYTLQANLTNGFTFQTAVTTGKGFFSGDAQLLSGDTNTSSIVPEPGTLGLLGTGLLGIGGVLRRKLKST
jgi:PEP-CTERM motif